MPKTHGVPSLAHYYYYYFNFFYKTKEGENAGGRGITQHAGIYCRKERKKLDYVNTLKG